MYFQDSYIEEFVYVSEFSKEHFPFRFVSHQPIPTHPPFLLLPYPSSSSSPTPLGKSFLLEHYTDTLPESSCIQTGGEHSWQTLQVVKLVDYKVWQRLSVRKA